MTTWTTVQETSTDNGVDTLFISQLPRPDEDASTSLPQPTNVSIELQAPESGTESQRPEEPYPTGAKLWLTIATIAGALILGALDTNIVATAVPSITDEFHTVADVGWYSAAFRLSTCAFQFMYGKLYTLFPVKRVFMAANAIFLISSVLCATADSSAMFVVGRAVSGLGFAGILSGLTAFRIFPPHRRPAFIGLMCGVESVAIASAPILGGALTEARGWRWCFWINLPVAAAVLLLTIFVLPDFKRAGDDTALPLKQKLAQLDLVSNLILIPGLACLFLALSWAGVKYPWRSGKVIGLLVTFVVLLALFLYNQHRRGDTAALPPRILRHRSIIAGVLFSTCVNSVLNVLSYYLPTYYQVVRGYAPARSGYMLLPIVVGDSAGAILHGLGTSICGYYAPFMLLASVLMPIAAGLMTTFDPATTLVKLICCSAAAGFSTGIGYMGAQSAALTVLKPEDANLGLSVIIFGANFGPAVFVTVAQVIFTNQLASNLKGSLPGSPSGVSGIENTGLSGLLDGVPLAQRVGVIAAVSRSLAQTWYLAVALGAATLAGSLLMEWRSVKQKKA